MDWQALWYGAVAASVAAMACSLLPGWFLLGVHLESTLREGGARLSMSGRALRARKGFLLAQTAVTVILLGLAALVLLSYRSMVRADTGFANRGAVTMNLALRGDALPEGQSFTPEVRRALYDRLLTRLRNSPGITSAAAILLRPLEGTIGWDVPYEFEFEAGNGRDRKALPKANYEVVTPEYFRTVGTALLEGRDFNRQDTETSEKVVIVNRALGERIRSAGHEPLGYRVRLGLGGWARVVGVCADARYRSVTQAGNDLYVPDTQANPRTNYLVIAGSQSAAQMTAMVRRLLAEMAPTQTIAGVATMGELIDANSARQRFNVMVLLWFGVCAAILAATAVYCAIAETLAARRHEMAIKMALGSQRGRLVKEMVSGTLWFVLAGDAVGLGCTMLVGSMASNLLYGVSAEDPFVLAGVGMGLLGVALVASIWPADPVRRICPSANWVC